MTNNLPVPKVGDDHFPCKQDLVMNLPAWLDGSEGSNRNRNTVQQIRANTDLEAIEAWLRAKRRRSPNTQRAYRREAYRLLAWAIAFKQKPLSGLSMEEVEEFHDWLIQPENHPLWAERGWVLFRGPLSAASQRQALVILSGMFSWLVHAGYLAGNPFRIYDSGVNAKEQAEERESEQERFLPHELWCWVQQNLDALFPPNNKGGAIAAYERKRFIVIFLYWTGVRRSELATAVMSRIKKDGGQWVMKVKGKGRTKLESVVVGESAMQALCRYRIYRGLPEYPSSIEDKIPVVSATDGVTPVSDHHINNLVKDLFKKLAAKLAAENAHLDWEKKLKSATAHWMRHSLATHNAEAGVSIEATANQLRHRSMDTTRKIYTHTRAKHLRKELDKLEEYNATERE